jgi:hypothetical protein
VFWVVAVIFLPLFCYGAAKEDSSLLKAWKSDQVSLAVIEVCIRELKYEIKLKKTNDPSACKPEWDAYQAALEKIFEDSSAYGDCALVQLTFDPHATTTDENAAYYITQRGKKMIPILILSMKHPVDLGYPETEKVRVPYIASLIRAINQKEILGTPQQATW